MVHLFQRNYCYDCKKESKFLSFFFSFCLLVAQVLFDFLPYSAPLTVDFNNSGESKPVRRRLGWPSGRGVSDGRGALVKQQETFGAGSLNSLGSSRRRSPASGSRSRSRKLETESVEVCLEKCARRILRPSL